ncbi:MAG: CDP-alcohol phosphatidyltransferase family protein [Gemmatimonadales bacterium]
MPEGSPPSGREQARRRFTVADALTLLRLPLAALFVAVPDTGWRLAVLVIAGATDLLDGFLARWLGGSRLGSFLDPVADKLFMAAAFGVVAFSGRLDWYEIAGVLARDAVATIAFVVTAVSGRPTAIPARLGGKAVTVCQMLTLIAFVVGSPLLRPLAWATGAIALYAIWDYSRAAGARRRL